MDSYQGQGRHTGPSTCQVTMFIHFMGSDQISQIHVLLCIPLFMFCSRAVASTNTSHQRPLSHRPGSHAHPSPLPPGYYVQSHQRAQPTPCLSAGNDSCSGVYASTCQLCTVSLRQSGFSANMGISADSSDPRSVRRIGRINGAPPICVMVPHVELSIASPKVPIDTCMPRRWSMRTMSRKLCVISLAMDRMTVRRSRVGVYTDPPVCLQ